MHILLQRNTAIFVKVTELDRLFSPIWVSLLRGSGNTTCPTWILQMQVRARLKVSEKHGWYDRVHKVEMLSVHLWYSFWFAL